MDGARTSYSRCSSIRAQRHVPSGAGRAAPTHRLPGGGGREPGAACSDRLIRQRSSRSPPATGRPARRRGSAAVARAGADRMRDLGRPTARRARPRAGPSGERGMGCWVRTAATAQRSGPTSDRRGVPSDPGWSPGRRSGRQCVPAAPEGPASGTGTLPRPARGGPQPPESGRRRPWRTALALAGGLVLLLAFPSYGLSALAPLGPAALALAVHGRRFRSGLWLGLVFGLAFFVPLLSWTGTYVGAVPWLALALMEARFLALARRRDRADLAAAVLAAVDGGAVGGRRGAARARALRRLPLGPARVQPDRGPADVAGGLRRRAAGELRRRPDRRAAGRGGTAAGAGLAERLGAAAGGRRAGGAGAGGPRRGPRRRRRAGRARWSGHSPGCRCPAGRSPTAARRRPSR